MMLTCYDIRKLRQNGGYALDMIERKSETHVKFGVRSLIPGDVKRLAIIYGSEEARENAKIMIRKVVEEGRKERKSMSRIKTRSMAMSSSNEYGERNRSWSSGKVLYVNRGPENMLLSKRMTLSDKNCPL